MSKQKKIAQRKLPTPQQIYVRAASMECSTPDLCGDGWNSWDCAACMAKARFRCGKEKGPPGLSVVHSEGGRRRVADALARADFIRSHLLRQSSSADELTILVLANEIARLAE